jgi:signal transduction histidine kinase
MERDFERMQIVFQMATTLNATLDYERVLQMAIDLSTSALAETRNDENRIKSVLLLFKDGQLQIESARGLSHMDLRATFPCQRGLIAEALANGEVSFSKNPKNDPELRRVAGFHTTQSAVCIPLRIGLEAFGALLFGHPKPDYFKRERLELLEAVAQQAMIALQNARLYSELEQEKQRILEIHDEARKKLARDLHDGPTQSIAAIAMRVNFARRLIERDPRATASELFKVEELARKTTKEIRQMLFTLRPLILESQGLASAVEQLAEKMEETHGQKMRVDAQQGAAEGLSVKKQGLIFSIIEEAVTNARKHAQAELIHVRLSRTGELIRLEIEDNGVGFDLQAVEEDYARRGSLGMVNLQERADLLDGLLEINSAPGRGTRICLIVPTSKKAADSLHQIGFTAENLPIEPAELTK